jgi:uncharacterized 2Fe-2S/4Fe-4S cluster protein (DUF4445 family)
MPYQIAFQPLGRRVTAAEGQTILTAAHDAGVPLASVCGGAGTCGRCQVRLVRGAVSPLGDDEAALLPPGEIAAGYRLACQARVLSDIELEVPAESLAVAQRLQVAGELPAVPLEPAVRAYTIALSPPSLSDLRADIQRLADALSAHHALHDLTFDLPTLRALPEVLRAQGWQATVDVRQGEVVAVRPPGESPLGAAVDLGTTKIAAYLVDLATGETLAAAGVANPQIVYGEDVMARLAYAVKGEAQAQRLQVAASEAVDRLVASLCTSVGRDPAAVSELVLVGNTAMHHLFLGLPVAQLGLAPYVPAVNAALDVKARDLGLHLAPGAVVHLLPNIAGFVGADHVAFLIASIVGQPGTILGLDIGTNTEVALAHDEAPSRLTSRNGGRDGASDDKLFSCSTASGPAFEGAHIRHGMHAASGAIEKVWVEERGVRVATIDGRPAVGICGSGILDAIAALRRAGALNDRGRMQAGHPLVRRGEDGLEVVLVEAAASGTGRDIVVTQGDVSQVQLAKGAIRAGIQVLLDEAGIGAAQLSEVVIAGAFGSYLDPASAVGIGLFPPLPLARFRAVGNAAGAGARLALLSLPQRALAAAIARRVRYVELTVHPRFVDEFARGMLLP